MDIPRRRRASHSQPGRRADSDRASPGRNREDRRSPVQRRDRDTRQRSRSRQRDHHQGGGILAFGGLSTIPTSDFIRRHLSPLGTGPFASPKSSNAKEERRRGEGGRLLLWMDVSVDREDWKKLRPVPGPSWRFAFEDVLWVWASPQMSGLPLSSKKIPELSREAWRSEGPSSPFYCTSV